VNGTERFRATGISRATIVIDTARERRDHKCRSYGESYPTHYCGNLPEIDAKISERVEVLRFHLNERRIRLVKVSGLPSTTPLVCHRPPAFATNGVASRRAKALMLNKDVLRTKLFQCQVAAHDHWAQVGVSLAWIRSRVQEGLFAANEQSVCGCDTDQMSGAIAWLGRMGLVELRQ
jgi:hypothetical protein